VTSAGVPVTSAAESAARDRAAIGAGVPSRALMRAAGMAAAAEIVRRFAGRGLRRRGVAVFAGPGNNGGDAWVVAGALAAGGIPVRMIQVGRPGTPDAIAERAAWMNAPGVAMSVTTGAEALAIDGLLGTGASGAPRGAIADAVARIALMRDSGVPVVALDVPTGVDATTGDAAGAVVADVTLTFGTMKRGLLVARGHAGMIVVLDIGLGSAAVLDDGAARAADRGGLQQGHTAPRGDRRGGPRYGGGRPSRRARGTRERRRLGQGFCRVVERVRCADCGL
jgi:NAD(P)H-hydrate epimerase